MDLTEREKALPELLKALHELDVRINGIKVDACQCNLVAQVVLDVLKLDERREAAYRAGREEAARDILAELDRIKGRIDEKVSDRKIAACQKIGLHMASLRVVELSDRWKSGGSDG